MPMEPVVVAEDDVSCHPGEDQEQERCDERLEEQEAPAHERAGVRSQGAGDVHVEAACGRHLSGKLADRERDERAGDEREQHCKR